MDEGRFVRRLQVVERLQQRQTGAAAWVVAVERCIRTDERLFDTGERGLADGLRRERHDHGAGARERGEQGRARRPIAGVRERRREVRELALEGRWSLGARGTAALHGVEDTVIGRPCACAATAEDDDWFEEGENVDVRD